MASTNINRVILAGNLTRDPELRATPSGTSVCTLRLAVNERVKNTTTGEWTDRANYFNITVWGGQGESCARYLTKGSGVAIDGRLRWHEWETDGQKRQQIDVIAENVQFLPSGHRDQTAANTPAVTTTADTPAAGGDFGEDDIPF